MSKPSRKDEAAIAGQHYENFPVASILCPVRLRPPIAAIYAFARTADDIADEGDAPAQQRLELLQTMRLDLEAIAAGQADSGRWPGVFGPLRTMLHQWNLPVPLLGDLLDAFEQDVVKTSTGEGYRDREELLDYCRRSANPVGRLLLHLYGIGDDISLQQSDAICTALQLINFWQDLSEDIARHRHYLPQSDILAHGVAARDLLDLRQTKEATNLIAEQVRLARATMLQGAPLAKKIPGRSGWELRLVVQGGLRVAERIEHMGFATLGSRPRLGWRDLPVMLWRAFRM